MGNEFKYILELEGKDYGKHVGRNGEYVGWVSFKETNFFMSAKEAMDALVLKNISQFEEMSDEVNNNKYYKKASLFEAGAEEPLAQVIRISFSDSPDCCPPAGLYLSFGDLDTIDFERHTALNFNSFKDYDPNFSLLLLASYAYNPDSGFTMHVDPVIKEWQRGLRQHEMGSPFIDGNWKYKVETVGHTIEGDYCHQTKKYHFHELPGALRFLLKTDINILDKELAEGLEEQCWASKITLEERPAKSLVDIIAVKNPDTDEKVSEPGVHLKFSVPIEQLEQEARITLSGLGNYGQDDTYLLLAKYFVVPSDNGIEDRELSPCPGYTSLLINIDNEPQQVREEYQEHPFLVRVIWEKSHSTKKESDETNIPMVRETSCASIEEGLSALAKLDAIFFDKDAAAELQYPLFITHADVVDQEHNIAVLSKYQKVEDGNKQICISIEKSHGSFEILKQPDHTLEKKPDTGVLKDVPENRTSMKHTSDDFLIERRKMIPNREIKTSGTKGPRI